jgi:hypothetical protein
MAEGGGAPARQHVLHVVASATARPEHEFLGTTKDARGHAEYLAERGLAARTLHIEARRDTELRSRLDDWDLAEFEAVLLEGAYFPDSIAWLKRRRPTLRVWVRGVNAEAWHWRDSARAAWRYDSMSRVLFDLKCAWDFGRRDRRCARRADAILAICDWEAEQYWPRLRPRRVVSVPYFVPSAYLRLIPVGRPRQDRCICLMSTRADRSFHADAARHFYAFADTAGRAASGWSFGVAGSFRAPRGVAVPKSVETLGVLANPLVPLAESRAVALLSDYGYGFKTKLLDAVCCGCWLIVPAALAQRLPACLAPYVLVVNPTDVTSVQAALERAREPIPAGDPNGVLRRQAFANLDALLWSQGGASPGAVLDR